MTLDEKTIANALTNYKRKVVSNSVLTPAGVLLLLFQKENELRLLFTTRTEHVEHHKGQISFPGGARESGDATIIATALRESEEEVGLSRTGIHVLGLGDEIETPTGFVITPVIAYLSSPPQTKANLSEVSEIFDVPFVYFLDRKNEERKVMELKGRQREVFIYPYKGKEIWGITAAILRSFVDVLLAHENTVTPGKKAL